MKIATLVCKLSGALLLIAALPCLAAVPTSVKLAPSLRNITQAVAVGHGTDLMQSALTRQLFGENALDAPRWSAAGDVQVDIVYGTQGTAPDLKALEGLGATRIHNVPLMGTIEAWLPASSLANLTNFSWVKYVKVPQYAITNRMGALPPEPRSVDSQGDQLMGAAAFRQATGNDGSGIDVGVINAGDAGLSQSQADGDLPSDVWVDPNLLGTNDGEGTAMMEIVHTLAPGASLSFCGPQTSVDFLTCLSDLQQHGAQVIVDDIAFPATAYFTNDSDVTAVQQWQSQNPTVRLVTAAGNFATSFWSGTYTPAAINPITVNGVTYNEAQNFGTNTNPNFYDAITVAPSAQVEYILEWADPWVPSADITGSTPDDPNDYDVVLYDSNFNVIACNQGMTSDSNGCSQAGAAASTTPGVEPGVANIWTNTSTSSVTVNLAIFLRAGSPSPELKLFVASPNSCEVTISPVTPADSIVDHAALPYPAEITVGAINASEALQGSYIIEPYSSEGPVLLPLLTNSPIDKPDFVGVDGVNISGAGGFPPAECGQPAPPPIYYGTSAAAPHVAALIALLESAGYSSDEVYGTLQQYATPLQFPSLSNGSGNPNGVAGYGLADVKSVPSKNVPPPSSGGNSGGSGGGGGTTLWGLMVLTLAIIRRRFCASIG